MLRARIVPVISAAALAISTAALWSAAPAAAVAPTPLTQGTVLVADVSNNRIVAVAPGGAQTTVGTGFSGPYVPRPTPPGTSSSPTPGMVGWSEWVRTELRPLSRSPACPYRPMWRSTAPAMCLSLTATMETSSN